MLTTITIAGQVLTVLVLLLAIVFVAWQCFEGLARITTMGAEFRHFIINRRAFERWNRELDAERDPVCGHDYSTDPRLADALAHPTGPRHARFEPAEPHSYAIGAGGGDDGCSADCSAPSEPPGNTGQEHHPLCPQARGMLGRCSCHEIETI